MPEQPILTFLGATGTVTGSRFLIETDSARVLVDAGLFQGLKELRQRNWLPFPVEPASVDAVVVTHAHVDHIGYLPALVAAGFAGPAFVTPGTAELARIVLPDCAHLQEEEAFYAKRKGYSRHKPPRALYTSEDADRALRLLRPVPFDHRIDVGSGISVVFRPAGHILGSATVELHVGDRSILFSGDLGRPSHPLLRPPAAPLAVDLAVVESTYGNRDHEDEASRRAFRDTIVRTAERGGSVVIPAFAVDRTEVVLLELRRLAKRGEIPSLPVFVDSPMALAALEVYRHAMAEGSPELRPQLTVGSGDPFDPGKLVEARTVEESIAINDEHYPSIIISASGMASGGRVLHHLRQRLPDPKNSVLLVGFQAEGTRGRDLAEGAHQIKLLGEYVPVRADVVDVPGFSIHADGDEMVAWLRSAPTAPKAIFVVHGEPAAARTLRDRIDDELGWTAVVPRYLERVRIS